MIGGRFLLLLSLIFFCFPAVVWALESPQHIGFFCGSDASITAGQFYVPHDGCTYLSPTVTGSRYGDIYRGTVGSSTIVNGHSLGFNSTSTTQFGDSIPDPQQGEDLFVAVFPAQFLNEFRAFFQTGAGAPIGNNFGFLPFKYGVPPPPEPETPDPVIIIPGILGSEQHNGEWIIDPILHTYDDLIATLDVNGYTPDVDLFTFPYNWRKSNVETAVLLKEKIDAVKAICQCDKVDLVAHSMGGLVARQYIQSDAYDQDIDQLIFLGTPHLGAPKAYLMWEGGEIGPFLPFSGTFMEKVLTEEAKTKGYSDLFAYIRNEPIFSVKELLPTYGYLFEESSLREYPSNYPVNEFLEGLNDDVGKLMSSGVNLRNFVGETGTQETITGLQVEDFNEYAPMWEHGYPSEYYNIFGSHGLIQGQGDKTVPIASSSFINSDLSITQNGHNDLPVALEGEIYYELTGKIAGILSHKYDSSSKKLLHILMHSPADLLIVAPDGGEVGKENGLEVNTIPDAFYTGFNTNTEFITILNPLDGEYKIYTEGTDSGKYTVETTYITEATTTQASFTGNTAPGLVTELKLEVNNQSPEDLEIISPDATPPVVAIASPIAKDYLRSEQLPVNVTAEDMDSGVQLLESHFDGTAIPNVGSIDLFYKSLGEHLLIATTMDNAGNATTSSRAFRVTANATSTISDFERAYSLGWMTKNVHDKLAKKFKVIVVIRKTIKTITQTIVETGNNGKKNTKQVKSKVEILEEVLDKIAAKAILKELDKYRGKGLNEQAYLLLKEDISWLIK